MDHYELGFEWDEDKSAANLDKHGIDFYEACDVWLGKTLDVPAKTVGGERRMASVGRISGGYWIVVWVQREDRRRIISAYHANERERSAYDRACNGC